MQVLLHLGAHRTDGGLLIRSILRNRGLLSTQGIVVPGPSRYRDLIGEVSETLGGEPASETTEDMLLEAIGDDDRAERIVLSNDNFLCQEIDVLTDEGLYPTAQRSAWLRNCFPSHDVEFALALRNPATLVPALVAHLPEDEGAPTLAALRPERLRWLDVVVDIAAANPDTPLTIWCHEDAPHIWGELMREITAHDPATVLEGASDMLETLLPPEATGKLNAFLESQGEVTPDQRRQAYAAFLAAHADDAPCTSWSDETRADLTAAYAEDIAAIAQLQNVTMVSR
ncbi:MAG: hypothetical protein AAF368_18140 [Planctomycetota bacterium]